jgi:hypothetical protein
MSGRRIFNGGKVLELIIDEPMSKMRPAGEKGEVQKLQGDQVPAIVLPLLQKLPNNVSD